MRYAQKWFAAICAVWLCLSNPLLATDIDELVGMAETWSLTSVDSGYNPAYDYNTDQVVDFKDFAILADTWGTPGRLFFVSANTGNDFYPGTPDQPFKTIQKAANTLAAGDICLIRQGIYRETVSVGTNGTPTAPIEFRAYPDEYPVVSGADVLNVIWTVHSDNIYKANTTWEFGQLFIDGNMMNEARWPNAGINQLVTMPRGTCKTGTNTTTLVDSSLPAGNWNGAKVHIVPGDEWISWTKNITNYQAGSQLMFDNTNWEDNSAYYLPRAGNYYWLFGSLAGLDTAGEWFLDTVPNKVYLWCPGNANPNLKTVEVKKRNLAFTLSGSYIKIKGLRVFAAAFNTGSAQHCTIENCDVRYVEHFRDCNGYYTNSSTNQLGGSYNEWKNCSLVYAAGNGIYSNGQNNKVTNCIVHEVNYMAGHMGAIYEYLATGSEFTHNTMYNSGRHIIYHVAAKQFHYTHNHMYNGGLLSADCGITYGWGSAAFDALGAEIAYNKVHGNQARWGSGVYLDAFDGYQEKNFLVHHNLIWDVYWSGIHLNDPTLNIGVYNNTILSSCHQATDCYALYPPADQTGTRFINNLHQCVIGNFAAPPYAPEVHHNGNFPLDPVTSWPTTGSGAINAGVVVPGITDGYVGAAPDIGCYEVGTAGWDAGANWTETPWYPPT